MLRVLHLTSASSIGGAEHLLLWLARAFDHERFEIRFATIAPEGPLNWGLRQIGAPVDSLRVTSNLSWAMGLARLRVLLRRYRIDILHTHLPAAGLMGIFVGRSGFRGRLIHTRHYASYYQKYGASVSRSMDRWIAANQPGIIAISDAVRDDLVTRLNILPSRIERIHNGIDVQWLRTQSVTSGDAASLEQIQHWRRDQRRIVGMVGNFHPCKGHATLIEAAPQILREQPQTVFVCIGGGPGRAAVESDIRRRGLHDAFYFPGHLESIGPVLSHLDVLAVPSILEGFGLVACEGMAMGVPVVASATEGLREVVIDGQTGRTFAPQDANGLARAVLESLRADNAALLARAKDNVESYFNIRRMADELQRYYLRGTQANA